MQQFKPSGTAPVAISEESASAPLSSAAGNRPSNPEQDASQPPPLQRYWKQGVISLVVIVLVLLLGSQISAWVVSLKVAPSRSEPIQRVHTVLVYETETLRLQELINGFGTARAMREVVLSAQVAGEIVETLAPLKVGQAVMAVQFAQAADGTSHRAGGDLIVRIDPQNYQERLDQTENMLREDQAELDRLAQEERNLQRRLELQKQNYTAFKQEYDRTRGLFDRNIVSQSELTRSELDLRKYEEAQVQLETELSLIPPRRAQLQARLVRNRNEVKIAKLDLDRTQVSTPITGQLSEIHVEQGQYVRVGDPLVKVVNLDHVEIPVGIPLHDYAKLSPRMQRGEQPLVRVRSSNHQQGEWPGLLVRASPVADPQTRTVEVFVVVDNTIAPTPLLPGTFVTISIDGPIYDQVVPLPRDAVYQGQVLIVEEGRAVRKEIDQTAVVESVWLTQHSLQPGQQVIMTNLDILTDGSPVRIATDRQQSLRQELQRQRQPTLKILD